MWKTILNNYRQEFIPTLRENKNFSNAWVFFYFLFFFPVLIMKKVALEDFVFYYSMAIPLMFVFLFTIVFKTRLSKTMFLMPLSEKDRRKYLIQSICVKIAIEAALFFVGFLVVKIAFPEYQYPYVMLGFAIPACLLEFNMAYKWKAGYVEIPADEVTIIKLIITMLIILIGCSTMVENKNGGIFAIICIVNFVLAIIYSARCLPIMLKESVDYEKCYVIQEKETK